VVIIALVLNISVAAFNDHDSDNTDESTKPSNASSLLKTIYTMRSYLKTLKV